MIPTIHHIKLHENPKPADGCGAFEVSCDCQWAGFAHTLAIAENYVDGHAFNQSSRGHQVIIERDLLDKPIVVDAQE